MTKIDCIVSQGDYLTVDSLHDVYGSRAAEITMLQQNVTTETVTIVVNQYAAEQIIEALKAQFDIK